jgi:hypothetical protein
MHFKNEFITAYVHTVHSLFYPIIPQLSETINMDGWVGNGLFNDAVSAAVVI